MVIVCALSIVSIARGEPLSSLPTRGDALSYLYLVGGIHTAGTESETIRAFETAAPELDEVGLALEVHALDREPRPPKAEGRRFIWKLGATFSRVDSVELAGSVVTIRGSSNRRGRMTCMYEFFFENRALTDRLDDKGCQSERSPPE
jgi:hypothetical protein